MINRTLNDKNSLLAVHPQLAKEWDVAKNGFTPDKVLSGKTKIKYWWRCVKGHSWDSTIGNRVSGNGCPECANKKVNSENSLHAINPELSKEWYHEKNNGLTPDMFTPGSGKKIWWKCPNDHEWQAVICDRSNGRGCPSCSPKTSFAEQAIYFYIKMIFPDVQNRYRLNGKYEIDIFIPSLKIGIEYDGEHWHKSEKVRKRDFLKQEQFVKENIFLIRVKELVKGNIEDNDFIYHTLNNYAPEELNKTIALVFNKIEKRTNIKIDIKIDIKNDRFEIYESIYTLVRENSIVSKKPKLESEWDYEKNKIDPKTVPYSSGDNFFWKCKLGDSWEASPYNRYKGTGCPYCANKKANTRNCLSNMYPEIAKEWNYEKNKGLTPENVLGGSDKKVWWKCKNGHEWPARIANRKLGRGCPYCAGQILIQGVNDFKTTHPHLMEEWHVTKNGELKPENFMSGSSKKIWWVCKDCGNEWLTNIYSRTKCGCRKCSYKTIKAKATQTMINKRGSFLSMNPNLALEWDVKKNENIKPSDFTSGSGQKVWWLCKNGHSWEACIKDRVHGNGCPACRAKLLNKSVY